MQPCHAHAAACPPVLLALGKEPEATPLLSDEIERLVHKCVQVLDLLAVDARRALYHKRGYKQQHACFPLLARWSGCTTDTDHVKYSKAW